MNFMKIRKLFLLLLTAFVFIFLLFLSTVTYDYRLLIQSHVFVDNQIRLNENKFYTKSRYDKDGVFKILIWSPLYDNWNFLQNGAESFNKCDEKRCKITTAREDIQESDAVLFHIRTLVMYDLPEFRKPEQKWIFFNMEPPPYSNFPGFFFMHNFFNWTMTYKLDSDIVVSYGSVTRNLSYSKKIPESVWSNKTKNAVWMVSHCVTASHREDYVQQLQKYTEVDVFGGCGNAVCPRHQTNSCLETFANKYKFYLAFENAVCEDYVTEKFFRALRYNIVPVVYGGANYESFAPPHSFIDAMKYTPRELAVYLNTLARNSSQYMEYFKWKRDGYAIRDTLEPCELCSMLHSRIHYSERYYYRDMADWWIRQSKCKEITYL